MTAAGEPRPRSRWPLVLLSVLLVLLAGAAIATAQLYWSSLRTGLAQMRASVAAAQEQQRRLLTRLRAAETALAERSAATQAQGEPAAETATDAGAPAESRAGEPPLRRSLPPRERGRLAAWLREFSVAAARLPSVLGPRRGPGQGPRRGLSHPVPAQQLLREQLVIAAAAAVAGDVRLLDATLVAAERLTGPPHRAADEAGVALARRLAEIRERLRVSRPGEPVGGAAEAAR